MVWNGDSYCQRRQHSPNCYMSMSCQPVGQNTLQLQHQTGGLMQRDRPALNEEPRRSQGRLWALGWGQRFASIHPLVWLTILILACLVPFLNKAFFIDDTLFLRAAEQIQKHPLDFYGFKINWFGYTTPMTEAFENPPLTCYYISLVASLVGWSEPVLHFAFLLPALAAAWGTFKLAGFYCDQPLLPAVIAVATPVFLVSATGVMCDVMLLAFWVWAVTYFEKGMQSNGRLAFLCSGVMAGLAFLTKYPAVCLVPLLVAYGAFKKRNIGWWLLAPLIALTFIGAYEWITRKLYGHGLFLSAIHYASKYRAISQEGIFEKFIVALGFLGGCFLPVLFYSPFLWSRRTLQTGVCLLAACAFFVPWMPAFAGMLWEPSGGMNWGLLCQLALFVTIGVQALCLAGADVWSRRDTAGVLLCLWLCGVFLFALVGNWTINARSLLPATPAVAILVARKITLCRGNRLQQQRRISLWPALGACAVCLVVVGADVGQANTQRTAAREMCFKYRRSGRALKFAGHWGWQYYLEQLGATPLDLKTQHSAVGDIILSPTGSTAPFDSASEECRLLENAEYRAKSPCVTMNSSCGAGFYAAGLGPLPFAFGRIKPERFSAYEVFGTEAIGRR